jgi:hypothetical protein
MSERAVGSNFASLQTAAKLILVTFLLLAFAGIASADSTWSYAGATMQGCNCAIDGTMTVNNTGFFMLNYDFTAGPYTVTPADSSVFSVGPNGSNNFNFGIQGTSGNVQGISFFSDAGDMLQANGSTIAGNSTPGTWTLQSTVVPPPLVLVTLKPTTFQGLNTTISGSFLWNTSTNALSNFNLTTTGMLSSFSSTPIAGGAFQGTLFQLSFKNASGDNLQLNYEDLPGIIRPLEDVPGTYATEYFIDCGGVDCRGDFFQRGGTSGDAVVTAVSTPEPATLTLVGIGLLGLFWRGKMNSLTEITRQ